MVYIFLANGFEEIETVTVADLLRRAEIQVKTVSLMDEKLVYGSRGIAVETDIFFKEGIYDKCEMLVLPGGMPGTTNLCNHKELNAELKKFYLSGKPVANPTILSSRSLIRSSASVIVLLTPSSVFSFQLLYFSSLFFLYFF